MQTRRRFLGALAGMLAAPFAAKALPTPEFTSGTAIRAAFPSRLDRQAYSAETLRVMSAHMKFDSMLNRSWDQYFEERQPIGAIKIVRPPRFTGFLGPHDS